MTQSTLQRLLEDTRQAGIYHLPESGRAAVGLAAQGAGFACFEIDFGDSNKIDSALAEFGRALDFPNWYGNNLDALRDCLTDLSWREAPGYVLIIARAELLQAEDPVAFQTLYAVLAAAVAEWRSQGCPMWVFFDLRADGLATLPTLA